MPRGWLEAACHHNDPLGRTRGPALICQNRGWVALDGLHERILVPSSCGSRALRSSFGDFLGGSATTGADITSSEEEPIVGDVAPKLQVLPLQEDSELALHHEPELRPVLEMLSRGSEQVEKIQPHEEVIEYWAVEGSSGDHGPVIVHSGHKHHHVHHTHGVEDHQGHQSERPGRSKKHAESIEKHEKKEPEEQQPQPSETQPQVVSPQEPVLPPHLIFDMQDQGLQPNVILGGVVAIFAQVYLWGNVFVTLFKPQRQSLQAQGGLPPAPDVGAQGVMRSTDVALPAQGLPPSGPGSSDIPHHAGSTRNHNASNVIAVA